MRTLAEVEAEMNEKETKRSALKEELRALEAERNMLLALSEINAMPESKRKALKHVLMAQSAESGEKFGLIGE